jgi:DNA-binding NtrC family response regulator
MNPDTPHNSFRELSNNRTASELSIALVSPDEKRRAAAADSASHLFEFASYLDTPADQARMSQMQYDVIMIDIDGDTERALKLVEKINAESRAWVLVYSSGRSPEKLGRCMRAGAHDFVAFPFETVAVAEALKRMSSPRAVAPLHRELPQPRKVSTSREAIWRHIFNEPLARSQARP